MMSALFELIWAAGFYDGEGHCGAYVDKRDDSVMIRLCVVQSSHSPIEPPDTLLRFQSAVGGEGLIRRRSRAARGRPQWIWVSQRLAEQKSVIELLAPHVGHEKRMQFAAAMAERARYEVEAAHRRLYCKRGHLIERGARPRNRCQVCYETIDKPNANKRRRKRRAQQPGRTRQVNEGIGASDHLSRGSVVPSESDLVATMRG